MAKKKTPQELREQAQKLLEDARRQEQERQQKIGELVTAYIEKNFLGFELQEFKAQAIKIWKG